MASEQKSLRNGNSKEPSLEDDWERKIDNGTLDQEIEKLTLKSGSKSSSLDGDDKNLNEPPKVQVRLEEPPLRTPFAPGVRILKREPVAQPNSQKTVSSAAPVQKKSPPATKSFDERRVEYYKARERIMGSQTAPGALNGDYNRPSLLETPNNRYPQQTPQQLHHPQSQQQPRLQQINRERKPSSR